MTKPPEGCPFAPRCPYARQICAMEQPPYVSFGEHRRSMCWLLQPDAPAENNPFRKEAAK